MVKRLSLCEKRDKEMNKREALGDSSIHLSVLGVYKGIETAIRNSGLMARFSPGGEQLMNQREHEAWIRDIEKEFNVEREEAQEILRGIKVGAGVSI